MKESRGSNDAFIPSRTPPALGPLKMASYRATVSALLVVHQGEQSGLAHIDTRYMISTLLRESIGCATSFPGSSLFLPRETTLGAAGHVAPKSGCLTKFAVREG